MQANENGSFQANENGSFGVDSKACRHPLCLCLSVCLPLPLPSSIFSWLVLPCLVLSHVVLCGGISRMCLVGICVCLFLSMFYHCVLSLSYLLLNCDWLGLGLILSCFVLFVLFCLVLSCLVLSCLVLSCLSLALPCSCLVLSCLAVSSLSGLVWSGLV